MLKAAWGFGVLLFSLQVATAQDFNRFDVSVGYGAQFSKTSASYGNTTTLNPTSSGVLLVTVRHRFSAKHGVAFNIGHTSNSQVYDLPPLTFRVPAGITEYSGTYSLNPFHFTRIEPFLFAGIGILKFNPGDISVNGNAASFSAGNQSKLAFPYGVGVDYKVWRAVAVRLQYRGLIYKAPDFHIENLVTGVTTHMAEPTVGVVLRF